MRTVKQEYIIDYYDNGNISREEYLLNGESHRENGIAFKIWFENGNILEEGYYINGKRLTKEEFNNRNKTCNGKIIEIDGKKYKLKEI